jgi:intein/homing endonuclease
VGDKVYGFDVKRSNRRIQTVAQVVKADGSELVALDFGSETLRCTPAHRFYRGAEWVPAKELRAGDEILSFDGRIRDIARIGREVSNGSVFNLTVPELENFFVGEAGLLVHNVKIEPVDEGDVVGGERPRLGRVAKKAGKANRRTRRNRP